MYAHSVVVAVQSQFSAGRAGRKFHIIARAFAGRRLAGAIFVANCFYIGLLVGKTVIIVAASHNYFYARHTNFVKILESLINVYYNMPIIGGY